MGTEKENRLGDVLKALLKERSLSMRKLAAITGIDTATISRIANGKQPASTEYLQMFAVALDVPVKRLLEATGLELSLGESRSDIHLSVESIQEILAASNLFDQHNTLQRIEQELEKYERYAQTEEGQRLILEGFETKIQQVDGMGPFITHLKEMYERFSAEPIQLRERAILGSALLYFILSADIIPDYVFPIGYLDDALAVKLALQRLSLLQVEQHPEME
ncbi:helix-turn-helix domain-containing protein [Paenibacillus filicis]|uniref:Helix-turn-helix domain-containing protein n=1 Tax=Paenibacillus filicis TaxID=669464 RepID=A0ABU9DRX7_9BACL